MRYSNRHSDDRQRGQRSRSSARGGSMHQPYSYQDDPFVPNSEKRTRRSGTLDLPEKEQARHRGSQRSARGARSAQERDRGASGDRRQQMDGRRPRNPREDVRRANAQQPRSAQQRHGYSPNDSRENYSRSANRYTRARNVGAPASNAGPQRARTGHGNIGNAAMQANQYNRDRYVRQSGQQRIIPAGQSSPNRSRPAKPVDQRAIVALAAVAIILLAVIIVRFVFFGSTASQYESIQAEIRQEQAQLDEFESASAELQAQVDEWQPTIDEYNSRK